MNNITYEEAERMMLMASSYSRLKTVISLLWVMEYREWLKILGVAWSNCDNIAQYRRCLKSYIGVAGPIKDMMNDAELAAFDALPETITVYRGCGSHNRAGASWTLDRSVAERFPFYSRYRAKEPLLVTGRVKKMNVLAIKLDRDEFEIITFSARRVKVESLAPPPDMAAIAA